MRFKFPKTKVVATVGPSCWDDKTLEKLMKVGVDGFRLNMSHGDFSIFSPIIKKIRKISSDLGIPVAVIVDLPGPKMRLGELPKPIDVKKGDIVVFGSNGGGEKIKDAIYLPHEIEEFEKKVKKGDIIFVGDGFLQFKVLEVRRKEIITKALLSGKVRSHKGINVPGIEFKGGAITEFDRSCIEFAVKSKVDMICVSFVGNAEDIEKVKSLLPQDPHYRPFVLAKIERGKAVKNIEEIVEVSDALMVARGDLGVELPIQEIPVMQKRIIRIANMRAKPVIVATQMLESMVDNLRPTRAEVTDVANAILDGADAIMFSEETAVGKYPVEVVKMAMKIAKITEHELVQPGSMAELVRKVIRRSDRIDDMISIATYDILCNESVDFVVTPTSSGTTARRISRLRPRQWIIAVTDNSTVRNILNLSFGVFPMYMSRLNVVGNELTQFLEAEGIVKKDDRIVITSGMPFGVPGTTNSLKVIDV